MGLLKIRRFDRFGEEQNGISLILEENGETLALDLILFNIKGGVIEVDENGVHFTLGDKRLFISICEKDPVFS